jgi:Amidohydrolase family
MSTMAAIFSIIVILSAVCARRTSTDPVSEIVLTGAFVHSTPRKLKCRVSIPRGQSAAILLMFAIALVSCSSPSSANFAITHVTVIDVTGGPPQSDSTVLVSGTHISAIGPSSSIRIPTGAKVIDATGKFLIPGLADMHLHLTGAGEPEGSREFFLPLLVANGITTVRDMGGNVEYLRKLRSEITSGDRPGPQIFFTGPYLDGNPPSFQPSIVVQNASEAVAAVDKLKSEGVDFIKVQSRLLPDPYFAIARESKMRDIRFVGHVPDSITVAQASDAGQASIEHLTGVLLACSTREEELRERQLVHLPKETPRDAKQRERVWQRDLLDSYSGEKAAGLIKKLSENNTWQVPTLVLLLDLVYITTANSHEDDPRLKYVPQSVQANWRQSRKMLLENQTAEDFQQRVGLAKRSLEIVGKMNAANIHLMAGTDSAAPDVFPGFALHEELSYLVQAGLTPLQALQSATSKPAEFLVRSEMRGHIAAGQRADLALLDANPLDDIRNTEKIRAVVLNGNLLERKDLDGLLDRAARFAAAH